MNNYAQINLFGDITPVAEPPKPTRKHKTMQESHGEKPGHICKNCKHIIKRKYASTYYKCALWRNTASPTTDIKANQTACGLFQAWEGAADVQRRLSVFGIAGN